MIGGLVLAAGASRRFGGGPKQLAELDGRPLLEHALLSVAAVPAIERIVVVLGAHTEEILAAVDFDRAEPVVAGDWERGASASLRAGLDALGPRGRTVLVTLGDQPFLTSQVVARLVAERGTCRAAYAGRPGHPVRLTPAVIARARTLEGDAGARSLLARCRLVECGHLALGIDVDTREDLARAVRTARRPPRSAHLPGA